jgi:hypothetical protein
MLYTPQVFCDGVALALPTRTSYHSFHDDSVWDGESRLSELDVSFGDSAMGGVCLTISYVRCVGVGGWVGGCTLQSGSSYRCHTRVSCGMPPLQSQSGTF